MSFLDELKGKFCSTDEVEKERQASLIDKVNRDAQETADRIKADLLMSVERGEYTHIGSKKTVTVTCYLPVDYYQHREVPATYTKIRRSVFSGKQPPIMDIGSYSKTLMSISPADRRKYNLVQQTPTKTIFEAKNISTYTMFITKLTELLSDDGIEVMPIIFNAKTGKELGFPCEVEGKVYWLDYSFMAKCICNIPEKYSTDEPVAITIEQSTEREDIFEAIEQSVRCKGTAKPQIGTIHDKLQISLTTLPNGTIKVRWNKLNNVVRYDLFRADGNKPLERLRGIDKESVLFSDRKLRLKRQYYYQLVAVIDDGIHREYKVSSTIETIKAGDMQKQQSVAENTKIPEQISFDKMEGHDFEHFCARLLRKNGFDNVDVTRGSGDQGVDIIAYKDGVKFGIQCKCYSTDIGNKAVQEAYSGKAYYNCHVGIVLTNRYFTRSAIELAQKNGILLWDRSKLLKLMQGADI